MNLRHATREDIAELFNLPCKIHRTPPYDSLIPVSGRKRFLQAYQPGSKLEKYFYTKLSRFISDPNHFALVAEIDEKIVGYRLIEHRGNDIYAHGLFVDPDYQGRGIGRQLFTKPLTHAKPGDTMYLKVLQGNLRARGLYESEGFTVTGQSTETFYGAAQIDMSMTIDKKDLK